MGREENEGMESGKVRGGSKQVRGDGDDGGRGKERRGMERERGE